MDLSDKKKNDSIQVALLIRVVIGLDGSVLRVCQ